MTRRLFAGFDPGSSGAIAVVGERGQFVDRCRFHKKPLAEVADWLWVYRDEIEMAYLEKVGSMTGQGRQSMFKFGRAAGWCDALIASMQIPHQHITPNQWMTFLKCKTGGDKSITRMKARELFPRAEFKITDHEADAMLIAECCRRKSLGVHDG